jgi:hypothetical protein
MLKDYYSFVEDFEKHKGEEHDMSYINHVDVIKNCPRILQPLQLPMDDSQEQTIRDLYQVCVINKPDIEVVDVNSFDQLEDELLKRYKCDMSSSTTEVDIDKLTKDLSSGKTFYKINQQLYRQVSDFRYMNKFLSTPQIDDTDTLSVPYNKCLAVYMVMFYMQCNFLCNEFVKNMEMIIGNFHGLLDMREIMLKLHFPLSIAQEDLVASSNYAKLADGFPTLVDMKLSFYKFNVMENGHKISLCFSRSKSFYMNKITYSTFGEHFENMQAKKLRRYQQFRLSMIYTFKLIIPDQENFELAKSVGYIDSNRIDWQFWKDNVIRCPLFNRYKNEDFLVKRQYELLSKMKSRYYNFIMNLYTDYQRNFVHEPVSLIFNIAAIIFALAGVFQVLQNARIIPPKP